MMVNDTSKFMFLEIAEEIRNKNLARTMRYECKPDGSPQSIEGYIKAQFEQWEAEGEAYVCHLTPREEETLFRPTLATDCFDYRAPQNSVGYITAEHAARACECVAEEGRVSRHIWRITNPAQYMYSRFGYLTPLEKNTEQVLS